MAELTSAPKTSTPPRGRPTKGSVTIGATKPGSPSTRNENPLPTPDMVARKATLGKMPISQLKRLRAASKNPAERAMITEVIQSIDNKTMGDRLDKMQGDPKYMSRKAAAKGAAKGVAKGTAKGAAKAKAKAASPMMSEGGLTQPTKNQTGLKKLPTAVRNKMGFFKSGGMAPSGNNDMRKGGMFK